MNLSEEQIDILGLLLEEKGFSHNAIDDYFLEHFGVKGMKWGVRRQRPDGSSRQLSKKQKAVLQGTVAVGGAAVVGVLAGKTVNAILKKYGFNKVGVAVPHLIYTTAKGQRYFDYTSGVADVMKVRVRDIAKLPQLV